MPHGIIDPDDLTFDGVAFDDVDVVKLHATCLVHMSRFVANPTGDQAALIAAILEALSRHEETFRPPCGCDVYRQARSTWLRLASGLGDARPGAQAALRVRH